MGLRIVVILVVLVSCVGHVTAQELTKDTRALLEQMEQLQLSDAALKENREQIQKQCKSYYAQAKKKKDPLLLDVLPL